MTTEVLDEKAALVARVKLRVEAARNSLSEFGGLVFGYPAMAHHQRWIRSLENEAIRWLMILGPPASGKTVWIGNVYLTWKGARRPEKHYCYLSFGQSVAESRASPIRLKIEEKRGEFRLVFPEVLPDGKRTWGKEEWSLVGADPGDPDATFTVASLTRGALGKHFHEMIIDDPHDPEDAVSKAGRENAWRFVQQVVLPRLLPGGRLIVDGFRWAEDDVPGRLREQFGWHTDENCNGKCSAGAEPEFHVIETVAEPEKGVSFWPEQWPYELLQAVQKRPSVWNAQYMQRPRPDEGHIFKWWHKYEAAPAFRQVVVGFDAAITGKERDDYVAWSGWGVRDRTAYLIEAGRVKAEGGDAERHVGMFAEKMKKIAGPMVPVKVVHRGKVHIDRLMGQFLGRRGLPVIPLKMPHGDLEAISNLISPFFEGGRVLVPESLPEWWLEEHKLYPFARHDDGVAATVAALFYIFLYNTTPRRRLPIFLWSEDAA